ncbi:hypothetical protein EVAR_18242_1 [Eumeta japonica]|uniref:Uncharacterized protein n=1 Tax=Eumeta variegata TaxID=151549 RepID=A0A4C1UJK9_EUMVA|nr:hypothetical protein EVAR_18242_1 [Eumeta japonica]
MTVLEEKFLGGGHAPDVTAWDGLPLGVPKTWSGSRTNVGYESTGLALSLSTVCGKRKARSRLTTAGVRSKSAAAELYPVHTQKAIYRQSLRGAFVFYSFARLEADCV